MRTPVTPRVRFVWNIVYGAMAFGLLIEAIERPKTLFVRAILVLASVAIGSAILNSVFALRELRNPGKLQSDQA